MSALPATSESKKVALPDVPALCVNSRQAALLTTDGEIKTLPLDQARLLLHKKPVMVCHTPFTKARLELDEFLAFDVLELFAFVHPARFCVPTPAGLAKALFLRAPENFEDAPATLMEIAIALLKDLKNDPYAEKADPLAIAGVMGLRGKGWAWTPYIFSALGETYDPAIETPLAPRSMSGSICRNGRRMRRPRPPHMKASARKKPRSACANFSPAAMEERRPARSSWPTRRKSPTPSPP